VFYQENTLLRSPPSTIYGNRSYCLSCCWYLKPWRRHERPSGRERLVHGAAASGSKKGLAAIKQCHHVCLHGVLRREVAIRAKKRRARSSFPFLLQQQFSTVL